LKRITAYPWRRTSAHRPASITERCRPFSVCCASATK